MNSFVSSLFCRRIAVLLIVTMTMISVVPRVEAGFIPSEESYSSTIRDRDMKTVQRTLENKMVQERLQALGYTDEEIDSRLAQLSDQELHKLATQMDSLNQGGVIGVVIGVLLIVILVIVILKLTNKRITIS